MNLSPDGRYYIRMHDGMPVPRPYAWRWLLPLLPLNIWALTTWTSLVLTPVCAAYYFSERGLHGHELTFAVALLSVVPGVWRLALSLPILCDTPAFAAALAVAALSVRHPWAAAVAALPLGAAYEKGPVFAALWGWSWWPLMGLTFVGWFRKHAPHDETTPEWIKHPFLTAMKYRERLGLDMEAYLLPFGASLLAFTAPFSWQVILTTAVAFGQLFIAQDTIRLLVWAAPVLVCAAVPQIPQAWYVLALVFTLLSASKAKVV